MNAARSFLRCILILLPTLVPLVSARAQSPAGKEFVVVLPSLMEYSEMQRDPGSFTLEVLCPRQTNVTVKWADGTPVMTSQVSPGLRATFTKPLWAMWQIMQSPIDFDTEKPNKRALVITTDQPVTVQALFDTTYRSESYQIYPVSSYDTSYTVMTYAGWAAANKRSGAVIMASEDNTEVKITPSAQTWAGHMQNVEYTIHLNRYEVYQLVSTYKSTGVGSDLTGTTIRSNKPIGVLSFSAGTNSPTHGSWGVTADPPGSGPTNEGDFSTKTLLEHQIPESRAGTTFLALPIVRTDPSGIQAVNRGYSPMRRKVQLRRDSSAIRFAVLQYNTTFDTNGVRVRNSAGTGDSIFGKGSRFELLITGPVKVDASKPVIGMEYEASGRDAMMYDSLVVVSISGPDTTRAYVEVPYGDPSMVWLPPVQQYKPNLQISIPNVRERREPVLYADILQVSGAMTVFWRHYLIITAPASAVGKVTLNGSPIGFGYTFAGGQYVAAYQRVFPGQRQLIESPEPIGCISYGMTWFDSYATTAGESVRSFATAAPDTLRFFSCDVEKDTIVTLRNLGAGDFRIDSMRVSGITATLVAPDPLPFTVAGNAQQNMLLRFQTPSPGVYTGTIRFYTDANNQAVLQVPFVITRDSARLALPASTIDFGVLKATQTQRDTTITVRNNGTRPLVITSITFTGAGYQVIGGKLPDTIAPGGSRQIQIRFTPTADGLREATMHLNGTPCLTGVDIVLRGFKGGGASLLIGRTLIYENYLCNAPEQVDSVLLLRSVGDEPVVIATAAISGPQSAEFMLLDTLTGVSVLPGDTLRFRVRYTPAGVGARRATLHLTTNAKNGAQIDIDLMARKDTVTLVPSTDTLQFGRVLSCGDTLVQTVTLRNVGTIADTITTADVGGVPAYIVSSSLPIILQPFTSQDVQVRFAPGTDGAFNATLNVHGTPCDVAAAIALRGERTTASLTGGRVVFDTVYSCNGQASGRVVLTNTGLVADTLRGASDGAGIFTVQGTPFPHVIEPGTSDTIDVFFSPPYGGYHARDLQFFWGPCDGTTNVAVSGFAGVTSVALSATMVDFGTVNAGTTARRTVMLRNTGTVPRTLTSLQPGVPDIVHVIRPTTLPLTLAPGDSVEIELEYAPPEFGAMVSTLSFGIAAPCGEDTTIVLNGTASGEDTVSTSLSVAVPDTTGAVDQVLELPIRVRDWNNVAATAPSGMRIVISYRYTLLLAKSITTVLPGMTASIVEQRIDGMTNHVTLALTGSAFPANGELARLACTVLVGDTDRTAITVDSVFIVTPPKRLVTVTRVDGSFFTLGICQTGGSRFVRLGGGIHLKSVRPNPFRDALTLEFDTDIDDVVTVTLFDALGNLVAVPFTQATARGSHSVRIDGRTLPTGMYVCEISNGRQRVRSSVMLVQ